MRSLFGLLHGAESIQSGRRRTVRDVAHVSPSNHRKFWHRDLQLIQGTSVNPRSAFTLIELLVVIAIILILSAVTIASFNFSVNADRVRSAARQFQSFLAGARDKAIYANDIRGVRLLLDPNDNHTVSAMQYIGSPKQEQGTLTNLTSDPTGHTMTLFSSPGRWTSLKNRGFLRAGCRIQIPSNTGRWYTVSTVVPQSGSDPLLVLDRSVANLVGTTAIQSTYVLELSPGILGDSQPVLFPRGVVIDLDGSSVPSTWRPANGYVGGVSQSYSVQMDILFSPRGTIVGDCAGLGMIHFHFADGGDVVKWHADINTSVNSNGLTGRTLSTYNVANLPIVPADIPATNLGCTQTIKVVNRDRILATLISKTGNVAVYNVNEKNSNTCASGITVADDAFQFAETGQVASK